MRQLRYACENCRLEFEADDPLNCPRCSSRKIRRAFDKKFGAPGSRFSPTGPTKLSTASSPSKPFAPSAVSPPSAASSSPLSHGTPSSYASERERVAYSHTSFVGREGKEGWKDFHRSEIKACPDCGSTDFELNWKHKEKVCRKCGSVFPMQRRST